VERCRLGEAQSLAAIRVSNIDQAMQMLILYLEALKSLASRKSGQGMVEYALILVLVSIVVIIILLTMGKQLKNVFSNVVAALG
jgi:pilus assembly protein Flp/PilA